MRQTKIGSRIPDKVTRDTDYLQVFNHVPIFISHFNEIEMHDFLSVKKSKKKYRKMKLTL